MLLLKRNFKFLMENDIKLMVSGDLSPLSESRKRRITDAIEKTKDNTKTVNILFNYGGKSDILHAFKGLVEKGITNPTERDFEAELYTKELPPVDLLIRTGGEKRLSNFMLWQSAYTELYFTDVLWPDFTKSDLDEAICWFEGRSRRYGGIK